MNWTEALGLTLLHFLWQGLIIGLLAAGVNQVLKTARGRYVAACAAMGLMGLSAIATFLWIVQPVVAEVSVATGVTQPHIINSYVAPASVQLVESWIVYLPWLDFLWFGGVSLLAMRSALSWMAAMRLKHMGVTPAPAEWQDRTKRLMQRLAITKPVRVCESALAEVPSVIGWLKPVVLIPAGTLAGLSAEQLETILAHELAHIRRHDYLVNLLQTAIETLLFYHPAVWWIGNRIRMERENCCDDLAVEACGDAFLYARALAQLEQLRQTTPTLALAATDGGLLSRIARLLGQRTQQNKDARSYWLPVLLMICLATAGLVAQQRFPAAPPAPPAPPSPVGVSVPPVPTAPDAPPSAEVPEPLASPEPPEALEPPPQLPSKEDFIETMERAGLKGLNVDQLVALKVHGVTPEYIQQTKAMGFSLDVDQLTAFRVHGVTQDYMNDWKSRGWSLTPDQLIAFRVHGVTAPVIDQMKAMGFSPTADDAVAMRVHNITPEFVKTWRDAGFKDLKFDDLVALRVHNAEPSMIQDLKALGFGNPTFDQIVQARIFEITPKFVEAVRRRGFKDLTFDQVVQLKRMDIIR